MTKRLIRCRTRDASLPLNGRQPSQTGNRLKHSMSAPLTFDAKPGAERGPTTDGSRTADRGPDLNERHRRFWAEQGVGTTPTRDAAQPEDINERYRRFWAAQAGK
ncbi:hypothetical protein [Burkholderia cepacia]|uniref:hypothetical protein n=1 Tax=Burkholderia cepacia TaxID=292 RepID=UPI000F6002A0|nr:hypothetical protein [Burkholderia cepacia]RRA04447.1 hypothetical protein DF054_23730 [Burkholderia cepacia]